MHVNKQKVDTVGGITSMLAGLVCLYFFLHYLQHHSGDSMGTVWLVFCVGLLLNGVLMLVHARRKGGLPGVVKELVGASTTPGGRVEPEAARRRS